MRATELREVTVVLFPLPFTPFEYYYWCDDRPESPTTFPIELVFRGPLQRTEFEQAIRSTVARHPLLNAVVDPHTGRLPRWIDAKGRAAPIDWSDATRPLGLSPIGFLDLTSLPGLRVQVRVSPEQSRVVLQFHHACCDALGGLQFIEELLVVYDSLIAGSSWDVRLPPLNPEQLRLRGDYGLSAADSRPGLRDALITARIWAGSLLRRPSILETRHGEEQGHHASPEDDRGYLTETCSQDEIVQLQAIASQAGATLNDLMLRDLFLVLHRWNVEQSGARRQRPTINVPVSLRSRADREMPAANSLGFWFLHRTAADCARPAALLGSVREETAAVKKWRLPLYFIGGLGIAARVPGLMRQMLRRKTSFATAVFSNVGRVLSRSPLERIDDRLQCGNVVLEHVTGVPPIRPGTRVAVVVVTYGNETTINLRSDPRYFSSSASRQLLGQFRDQLRVTVETAPSAVGSP